MSWLTFVLLALVLIFAVQGFRKGMLRMAISMVFFLMVLGVTSWLNPYISDFVREKTTFFMDSLFKVAIKVRSSSMYSR